MHIPTVAVDGVPQPLPDTVTVVDVREASEWVVGHIDGALHIPLQELPARAGELPEGQLLLVCTVGGRSGRAAAYLAQQGHDAYNLQGGLLDWHAAGRPLVSETGEAPYVA